mgnify:CR=1 FL=1
MCGCGGVRKSVGLSASDAAVMCLVCTVRVGEHCVAGADGGDVLVPISVRATGGGACPRGRHADSPRWLGVRWAGVPRPIRLALGDEEVRRWLGLPAEVPTTRAAREWRAGERDGCGCIVPLKAAWMQASSSSWMQRAAAAAVFAGVAMLAYFT